jgi:hypothetical protein
MMGFDRVRKYDDPKNHAATTFTSKRAAPFRHKSGFGGITNQGDVFLSQTVTFVSRTVSFGRTGTTFVNKGGHCR